MVYIYKVVQYIYKLIFLLAWKVWNLHWFNFAVYKNSEWLHQITAGKAVSTAQNFWCNLWTQERGWDIPSSHHSGPRAQSATLDERDGNLVWGGVKAHTSSTRRPVLSTTAAGPRTVTCLLRAGILFYELLLPTCLPYLPGKLWLTGL